MTSATPSSSSTCFSYPDPSQIQQVKNFLSSCFNTARNKSNEGIYQSLINLLKDKNDIEMLLKLIIALKSFTSLITRCPDQFHDLLHEIFSYNFICQEKKIHFVMIGKIFFFFFQYLE